jgi:hypothetical protein
MNDPAKKRIRRLEKIDASVRGKDRRGRKRKEQWKSRAKVGSLGSEGKPGRTPRHTYKATANPENCMDGLPWMSGILLSRYRFVSDNVRVSVAKRFSRETLTESQFVLEVGRKGHVSVGSMIVLFWAVSSQELQHSRDERQIQNRNSLECTLDMNDSRLSVLCTPTEQTFQFEAVELLDCHGCLDLVQVLIQSDSSPCI